MLVAASPATRPGPRPSTSREEIVECAIGMLDRDGPEALTFRAVARELGIAVGALSRYFRNLADLQDEVAARIMSDLRPLDAGSKVSLRRQLLRLSLDMLEVNRAHPYLLKIHGPASATVVARHTRQCLKVLVEAGIDFERAMAIYALVGNLPYAWAAGAAARSSPDIRGQIGPTYMDQLGEFGPQLAKLLGARTGTAIYRRWLLLYIDALLAAQHASKKKR